MSVHETTSDRGRSLPLCGARLHIGLNLG
jgi:hypothetical protein